jgi:hypothetical protein
MDLHQTVRVPAKLRARRLHVVFPYLQTDEPLDARETPPQLKQKRTLATGWLNHRLRTLATLDEETTNSLH